MSSPPRVGSVPPVLPSAAGAHHPYAPYVHCVSHTFCNVWKADFFTLCTLRCNVSGEAAEEIWNWSLLGVEGSYIPLECLFHTLVLGWVMFNIANDTKQEALQERDQLGRVCWPVQVLEQLWHVLLPDDKNKSRGEGSALFFKIKILSYNPVMNSRPLLL